MIKHDPGRVSVPVPVPKAYRRKGDRALGAALLKWYMQRVADLYFDGTMPGNALLWDHLDRITAARWATDENRSLAELGKAVLLAQDQDYEAACRMYRRSFKRVSQSLGAETGNAARSKKLERNAAEEYRRAEAIQARRKRNGQPPLKLNGLARKLAGEGDKPDTIRKHLARTCDLLERAGHKSLRTT